MNWPGEYTILDTHRHTCTSRYSQGTGPFCSTNLLANLVFFFLSFFSLVANRQEFIRLYQPMTNRRGKIFFFSPPPNSLSKHVRHVFSVLCESANCLSSDLSPIGQFLLGQLTFSLVPRYSRLGYFQTHFGAITML